MRKPMAQCSKKDMIFFYVFVVFLKKMHITQVTHELNEVHTTE